MVRETERRILAGKGCYLDDVQLPGMLHVAFVRSPYSHATIGSIESETALQLSGVKAVFRVRNRSGMRDRSLSMRSLTRCNHHEPK